MSTGSHAGDCNFSTWLLHIQFKQIRNLGPAMPITASACGTFLTWRLQQLEPSSATLRCMTLNVEKIIGLAAAFRA